MGGRGSGRAASDQDDALHDADRPQVAVPALDGVLADVAVAAEELDAVAADPHPVVRREPAGEGDLAGGVEALVERGRPRGRTTRRIPASSVAMSATVKATPCRWLIGSPNATRSLT